MNSDLHNFAAHFYDRKNENSEVRSYVICQGHPALVPYLIQNSYVPPLTYKALQDVGASSPPTAPNPVICFLPLFLLLLCFNTDPLASLRFLQQDNHALISATFAWNTLSPANHILIPALNTCSNISSETFPVIPKMVLSLSLYPLALYFLAFIT